MQVSLVSNAIPLPNDQPLNKNVLTTETPSPAPRRPRPKEKHQVDETAIPIPGQTGKAEEADTVRRRSRTSHRRWSSEPGAVRRAERHQRFRAPRRRRPLPTDRPRCAMSTSAACSAGMWARSTARWMPAATASMADPRTPKGARAYIEFDINRDGSHGDVRLDRSSGSPTWDNVCVRAAQRVDTFGPLPGQYRGNKPGGLLLLRVLGPRQCGKCGDSNLATICSQQIDTGSRFVHLIKNGFRARSAGPA